MPQKRKRTQTQSQNSSRRLAIIALIGGLLLLLVAGGLALYSTNSASQNTVADISQIPDEHDAQGIPYPQVPRISIEEARARYDSGSAIFVDVRSADEYQARHIPNALSIPEDEIAARYNELPKDQEIILYCT